MIRAAVLTLFLAACGPTYGPALPPEAVGNANCTYDPVAVLRFQDGAGQWEIDVHDAYGVVDMVWRRWWPQGVGIGTPDPACWDARPAAWFFPGGGTYFGYRPVSTMSLGGGGPQVWMKLVDTGYGALAPQEVTGTSCWESDDGGASWVQPDCFWFNFLAGLYGQTPVVQP